MSSSLDDLHPLWRETPRVVLARTQLRLDSEYPGSKIHVAVTFRPLTDQAAARAAGLSKRLLGMHQFGCALDAAVIDEHGVYVKKGDDPRYRIFGEVAIEEGCQWGGTWPEPDWDHLQPAGFTTDEFIAWMEAHRV